MEKYKYTGPTVFIGENGDIRLGTGQTVEAEVNINIAHVARLVFENSGTQEVDIDIAAKYLEPVEPDTIHFDPRDEVKNFYNADDDSRVAELVGLHNKHDNDHEVGGNHYKMAIEPWDYIHIVQELTDTYKAKNHDYGNSFADLFSECGMPYAYGHLKEKLNRIKSLMSKEAEVKSENMVDSLMDLANYAILTIMELRKEGKC